MDLPSDIKAAQEVHHRLEFYLVAVAFTIAGFAIQTGKFTGYWLGDSAETASWVLITASGAIGLWRLEYMPVLYRLHHHIDRIETEIEAYSEQPGYHERIGAIREKLAEYKPKLKSMEASNYSKYSWQKRMLVLGLICLMVSRFIDQANGWYW